MFIKSADTKIIESVLSEANVGDIVTYETLSRAIGRDVRKHAFSSLSSARRGVFKERQFVFQVIDNVGLQRLDDSGIVKSSSGDVQRMRRTARKALGKLAVVKFEKLNDTEKRDHISASAQIGAIEHFTSIKARHKIEKHVDGSKANIPIGETLKLFGD